jgi:hypothetical protein
MKKNQQASEFPPDEYRTESPLNLGCVAPAISCIIILLCMILQ